MIFGKKVKVKPVKKKDLAEAEVKLAESVRKLIEEKEVKIKGLETKLKELELESKKLKTQLDTLATEKKELTSKFKQKETESNELKSKLRETEIKLTKVWEEFKRAKEGKKARAPLEELVYAYVLGAGGEISIQQCAKALGVKKDQVSNAVDKLIENGRLAR
jgi:chromosome segregation ATPase